MFPILQPRVLPALKGVFHLTRFGVLILETNYSIYLFIFKYLYLYLYVCICLYIRMHSSSWGPHSLTNFSQHTTKRPPGLEVHRRECHTRNKIGNRGAGRQGPGARHARIVHALVVKSSSRTATAVMEGHRLWHADLPELHVHKRSNPAKRSTVFAYRCK